MEIPWRERWWKIRKFLFLNGQGSGWITILQAENQLFRKSRLLLPEENSGRRYGKSSAKFPYGSVITYGDIAKLIAEKRNRPGMSGQAVGGAVGHNPISIIIPCHRVVGSNGSLTGYAAGIDKKIQLLKLEGVDMSSLFVPKKGTAI